jgi:hypothetical protein
MWLGPGGYERLVARIRGVVKAMLPSAATVLMVSKGDEELLQLEGRRGLHFPQAENGGYAGHNPGSSEEAIAQLEALREVGAEYLVVPYTAFWWLGHYDGWAEHLVNRYELVHADDDTCVIFALDGHGAGAGAEAPAPPRRSRLVEEVRDIAQSLLPDEGRALVITGGDDALLDLGGPEARHFPQDQTGDHEDSQPASEREAILQLETLREQGADFLIIPETEFWWLDNYTKFHHHLERHHRLVLRQAHVCLIYELTGEPRAGEAEGAHRLTLPRRLNRLWRRHR